MLFQLNSHEIPKIRLMNSVSIQPPYIHSKRKADEYIIYVIKNGKMYLTENNINYVLSPGDFILLEPEHIHEGYQPSSCEYYYIHFRHNRMQKMEYTSEQELTRAIIQTRNDALKSDPFSYASIENERIFFPKYYHFANYSDFIKVCCLLDEAADFNRNHLESYKLYCALKILEVLIETYRSYVIYRIQNIGVGVPKSYRKVQALLGY